MLEFHAAAYGEFMSGLAHVSRMIKDDTLPEQWREIIRQAIELIGPEMEKLPLGVVVPDQYKFLRDKFETANPSQISTMVEMLQSSITADLGSHYFLDIEPGKKEYFEQTNFPFGENVHDEFQDSNYDISAASRCFALDEWTATVLHLMRALEPGLVWLGTEVGLSKSDLEHTNWQKIIERVEKAIRDESKEPKADRDRNRFLNEAASQFRYIKDAWRNYASHGKATYDENTSKAIWDHVRGFMTSLADWIVSSRSLIP